jgi:hypothetical protein
MSALCPSCKEIFAASNDGIHCDDCLNKRLELFSSMNTKRGFIPTLPEHPISKIDFTTATDCAILKEFKARFEGSILYDCKVCQLLDIIGDKTIKKYLKEKKNAKRD